MVDTSTEAVAKLLDGVTPGDWFSDGYRVEAYRGFSYEDQADYWEKIADVETDADQRFIAAARDLVPAMLAERDALKAEVERMKAQSSQSVKSKQLRYFDPQGDTLDQMRDHARQHPLAKEGDMKLVWVNEGDLYNPVFAAIQPVQSVTVQDAARDADLLLSAYSAVIVLHRMLDRAGLARGTAVARKIADEIVAAHPEFPGLTALRAIADGRS